MSRPLRIVFAGTPEFGLPVLDAIAKSHHELIAVYTQPDRPAGRGKHLMPSAIKRYAESNHIPVFQPINFKQEEDRLALASLRPDVLVVVAYGLILPQAVLDIPALSCINVHASLLPRWRGASPIVQAILHGDKTSGVCIMKMEAGLDTGPVFKEVQCTISDDDTAKTLHDKLSSLAVTPLMNTLDDLSNNQAIFYNQPDDGVTYAHKIDKAQAHINWALPAIDIERQVRAFIPWPVCYFKIIEEMVKVHQATYTDKKHDHAPGTVINIDEKAIEVACGQGVLFIQKLQFPGKNIILAKDCLNMSHGKIHKGLILL